MKIYISSIYSGWSTCRMAGVPFIGKPVGNNDLCVYKRSVQKFWYFASLDLCGLSANSVSPLKS